MTAVWSALPPFEESLELCEDLAYTLSNTEKYRHLKSRTSCQTLPDAPRISLDSSQVMSYCLDDLDTPGMNKLGEKLWLAGPHPTIRPLSEQLTIGRKIQLTEDPSLHCVWTDDLIYMKPIPAYIASYAFWESILDTSNQSVTPEDRERLRLTSLGFLKSYASLLQRRSDFIIAQKHDLLASFNHVTYEEFIRFIMCFDTVPNVSISSRWQCGELVLDALNFYSAIHLRKWHRNRFESRYGAYFQRFFPAVLFLFAVLSVVLNSLQVILSGEQLKPTDNKGLESSIGLFIWFSTEAAGWSLAFGVVFLLWWIVISSAEAFKRRRNQKAWKKKLKAEISQAP